MARCSPSATSHLEQITPGSGVAGRPRLRLNTGIAAARDGAMGHLGRTRTADALAEVRRNGRRRLRDFYADKLDENFRTESKQVCWPAPRASLACWSACAYATRPMPSPVRSHRFSSEITG